MSSEDLWMDAVVDAGEQFVAGEIDENDFRKIMKRLGFDPIEIDEQLSELRKDRENV